MRKYVAFARRPRADDEDGREYNHDIARNLSVFEPEMEPRPIGLLDLQGNELFSIDEREPIGFVLAPQARS